MIRLEAPFGPVSRLLLGVRDERLRRCWFCGAWAYAADACTGCNASAEHGRWEVAA